MNPEIVKELRKEWDDALSAIETVLEERPGEHLKEISQAVISLVRVRDRLIELQRSDRRSGEAARHLHEINAMLSVLGSLEYPLAGLRWKRIELVRDGLAQMLHDSAQIS